MNKDKIFQKMMGLGNEAQTKTPLEMWRHRAGKSLVKRAGATVVGTAMRSPQLKGLVLDNLTSQIKGPKREVIGHGYNQVVLADGEFVLKAMVRMVQDRYEDARDIAQTLQAESNTCGAYLGDSWLDTEFHTLALKNGRTMVAAKQPRLEASALLYPSAQDVPKGPERQLKLEAIHSLADNHGLYPDLVGHGNVARTAETPILFIDTVPLHSYELDAEAPAEMSLRLRMEDALESWRD